MLTVCSKACSSIAEVRLFARGRLKFNIKMGKPERDRIEDPLLQRRLLRSGSVRLKMRRNPVDDQKQPIL